MVSTRQMCSGGGTTAPEGIPPFGGSGSGSGGASGSAVATGVQEPPETTANRTSVLRRTTSYQGQQSHGSGQVTSPASLAYSASVVTRHNSCTTQMQRQRSPAVNLLDLPNELIEKILGYMDFKKISNLRLVSHRLNDICMAMLNAAFSRQIKTTFSRFQSIKASMPRRESARRNHPLACECDIIETCYMRLSLLQMSMGKHIERGHCCFFPGAILDEVQTILNYISITPRLQRPYRVTDELFDLSTMAMEYFKDRIESTLPGLAYFNKDFYTLPTTTKRPTLAISSDLDDSASNSPPQNHMVLRKGIRKIKQGMKMYNNQLSVLRTELRTCKRKAAEQSKQLAEQSNLLAEQQKQTLEYANRLDENDKKNEEMSRKFSTLLQELNKCKTELQFWRSKSPAIPAVCSSCNQKVAPIVPPEDFQVLVNQGVDPEHFIIINDDVDAESDVSVGELKEFASPDESTTAKLLAVSSAAKNLKRKLPSESQSNAIASTSKAAEVAQSQQLPVAANANGGAAAKGVGGYSPKLFYGNHQRSGVIVSPVSKSLAVAAPADNVASGPEALEEPEEAKKARRVQKANRYVNTPGKRSK
ncbi:F-box only protein 28 [Drosophila biarmipes]|uniref:F-box only protein 28 n=1 Tax=Drosophila biarmipes TaxID=125945 RepID=UPI0007E73953|nr:F-box only protein 28 [Drosophila biarmipes]XP_043947992.1 F-box only protein 28 [Drosophila biarmipes]